ncbi:MAG: hypothetical protein GY711_20595 [bacterium]|nr:hypothetical protein [bacterium]
MNRSLLFTLAATTVLGGAANAQVNDDCSGASTLPLGATNYDTSAATLSPEVWSCALGGGPDLWYSFSAPNTAIYTVETCGSSYDTALMVFDGSCGALNELACNDDSCAVQSSISFPANAGDNFFVRVGGWNGSAGTGMITASEVIPATIRNVAHYRFDETSGSVCLDSSPNANHGTYVGAVALNQAGAAAGSGSSADFNGIHGGVLSSFDGYVSIPAIQDLDDLRNDLSVAAWINLNRIPQGMPAGSGINRIFGNQGPGGGWSWGVTDNPGFRFTTHAIQDYDLATPLSPGSWTHVAVSFDVLGDATFYVNGANIGTVPGSGTATAPGSEYHIGVWNPISPCGAFDCAEFFDGLLDDLQVYEGALSDGDVAFLFSNPGEVVTGSGPIGNNYCGPAIPNSTGQAGTISANGSNNPSNNDLTLTASMLPPGQFGYFLAGQTQGFFNPPASSGIICLQGVIGRFNQVSQIISGPMGSISVDLTAIPTSPPVAVMPGESWNFQCWYRDGATNNFTDGINIQY